MEGSENAESDSSPLDLEAYEEDTILYHMGCLIDISSDFKNKEGIEISIKLIEGLLKKELTPAQEGTLYYFMANAWSTLKYLRRTELSQLWDYEQEEMEKEIIYLRMALKERCFEKLPRVRKCQILTNLGNLMGEIGRFVEALEYRNKAIAIDPSFAMAYGNNGYGIAWYSDALYDEGHKYVFLKYAHSNLERALRLELHPDAEKQFTEHKKRIEAMLSPEDLEKDVEMYKFPLGKSKKEIAYRKWCLTNRLFLNPLNDLGPYPIAAIDILHTPSITVKIDEGPYYQGYFNQLKQEFVSARYLYYEGINSYFPHFSDKDVYLCNTLDYPAYSLALEKVKIAFRINYSIFDKIAYFLNDYLKLSIPERRVNFKTLWYNSEKKDKGLRQKFKQSKNWPLRGLFWLSKDLYEKEPGFMEAIEPDAQNLSEIRNHMEHKYFKLHSELMFGPTYLAPLGLADPLAYSMYCPDFEEKTLRLMKIVRAAIIYLSTAIHFEEIQSKNNVPKKKKLLMRPLIEFDDDWKI